MKFAANATCGVAIWAYLCATATAQTPNSTATADAPSAEGIQDIVVTAQRREESLQRVPISVAAVTSEAMASRGITETTELQTAVVGLDLSTSVNNLTPFLRGVGTPGSAVGTEPSVATYVDGIYIANNVTNVFAFNNVERIEVLRGPQGTLFGRNASGGVINVVTRDPTQETKLNASAGFGNYGTYEGALYASTGLSQTLAVNFAAIGHKQSDGFGRNLTTGREIGKDWYWGVRGKLKWEPSASTTVVLAGDYYKTKGDGGLNYVAAPGTAGRVTSGTPTGFVGPYSPQGNENDYALTKSYGGGLTINQDVGFGSIVSITGYRKYDGILNYDQDGGRTTLAHILNVQTDRTFTQELQLLSNKDSPLTWILGLFYMDDKAAYDPLGFVNVISIYSTQKTSSYAGYAQATYEVLPDTNLTGGVRYTHDKRDLSSFSTTPAGVIIPSRTVNTGKSFEKVTYRISLDHRFTPVVTGYISYNRGFKSGVYNLPSPAQAPVRPEVLDAFEAGLKTDLLDRRLRFNASTFLYSFKDIQISTVVSGSIQTVNAAKARLYGGEIEFTALPVDLLTITGGISYIHSRYQNFPSGPVNVPNPGLCDTNPVTPGNQPGSTGPATGGNLQCSADLSGNMAIHAPKITANLAATLEIPSPVGKFDLTGSFYYNDGFHWEAANNQFEKSYTLTNASLQWNATNENLYVRGWIRNLFNTRYSQYRSTNNLISARSYAPPRTYGITIGVSY